ncbi:MAG: C45 family autoproteolytic acyltransferase/hydolase [Ktedonobacteraceae bacterium]
MDRHIPVVISEGKPFTRGIQLGGSEAGRVKQSATAYMALFRQRAGLTHGEVLVQAERFMPSIAAFAPHLLEEMRGIAEGAGCDLREIVAINARTELMYGLKQASECTAVGISPAASIDGHMRLAQNWDWNPALTGAVVLWVIRQENAIDLITLTEAGMVGKIGVNAAGLAMCVNLLISDGDFKGPAVPMHVILRRVLEEARSVEEAITIIAAAKRCTSCNHLLADGAGSLADVEATPLGQRVLSPTNGVLVHTNHCISSDLFAHDSNARDNPETLVRGERAQLLAEAQLIDENYLHALLSDHTTAPGSICLHNSPELPFEEQGESIASIVIDLTEGTLDIADGPPCQHPYRRLALNNYLRHYVSHKHQ